MARTVRTNSYGMVRKLGSPSTLTTVPTFPHKPRNKPTSPSQASSGQGLQTPSMHPPS
ncbi:MAG: hypothetical protein NZM04_03310 [Methylacidiphilales bacterium]|nr:hypothetical protein [Candidatus Methylacidiphilales bacterium]